MYDSQFYDDTSFRLGEVDDFFTEQSLSPGGLVGASTSSKKVFHSTMKALKSSTLQRGPSEWQTIFAIDIAQADT